MAKQLELLNKLALKAEVIGFLVNPQDANTKTTLGDAQTAANTLGRKLIVLEASTDDQIDDAFVTLKKENVGALVVDGDPFFLSRRKHLLSLVQRDSIPAIYAFREYVIAGGLMSYSPNLAGAYRQAGFYVGRILKGDKPGDLPVVQAAKFEFAINLKTAKALGLTVPPTLLADEVIE